MAQARSLIVDEVIQALRELGDEASWKEIRKQVKKNQGTGYSPYKDWKNFDTTLNQLIQQHCEVYVKYREDGPVYFEYVRRGRVRLAKQLGKSSGQISDVGR